jgi:hypothetical protein
MRLPQFTIRDLMWLMVVLGLSIGWFIDRRRIDHWHDLAIMSSLALEAQGWTVKSGPEGPILKTPDGGRVFTPSRVRGQVNGMKVEHINSN